MTQNSEHYLPSLRRQDPLLISYFATSFLSGNVDITFSSKERYRLKVHEYLNDASAGLYSENTLERDFNILECVKEMIGSNGFNLPVQKKHASAIKNEYLNQHSQVYKTMHFLNAQDQHGVMVGLVCAILNYIHKNISESFKPDQCKTFLSEIISKDHGFDELETIARNLFQISMQSPKADEPRKAAIDVVQSNSIRSDKFDRRVSDGTTQALNKMFDTWLDNWQYSSNDVKVRVMFARVIKYSNSDLKDTVFNQGIEEQHIESLHLDHMEPQKLDDSQKTGYFSDFNRDFYVNGLGNMMPLPGNINISKGNKPLHQAFTALKDAGLGEHWITKKTDELFQMSNLEGVPTKEFFDTRKDFIKNVFLKSITLS